MCFFKKKKPKQVITNNKFQMGECIRFRCRGEMSPGIIYGMRLNNDGEVIYDVQIGGECPAIIYNVEEKAIIKKN